MRHQDGGEAQRALQALDLDLHVEPQVAVEGGKRLVEKQDRRFDGKRAGKRHALLLAAGELTRQALAKAAELDDVEEARDPGQDVRPPHAAGAQPIGHVLRHGHVREQRIVLEDDADVALISRQMVDGGAVDPDTPRGLADEARDDAEQGGFATTRRPQQGHDLARLDGERHTVDGERLAIADGQVLDVECSGCRGRLHAAPPCENEARGMPNEGRYDAWRY